MQGLDEWLAHLGELDSARVDVEVKAAALDASRLLGSCGVVSGGPIVVSSCQGSDQRSVGDRVIQTTVHDLLYIALTC